MDAISTTKGEQEEGRKEQDTALKGLSGQMDRVDKVKRYDYPKCVNMVGRVTRQERIRTIVRVELARKSYENSSCRIDESFEIQFGSVCLDDDIGKEKRARNEKRTLQLSILFIFAMFSTIIITGRRDGVLQRTR
ncbi:hypothetical protein DINM_004279 [Dirofilaria immitis]|nr:hypothetical protein [Dirofilaria immitis]